MRAEVGGVQLRPAVPDDLEALEELDAEAFVNGEPASPEELALGAETGSILVAVDERGALCGYVQWQDHATCRYLSGIAVHRSRQRQGIGRRLLQQVLLTAPRGRPLEATTHPSNLTSREDTPFAGGLRRREGVCSLAVSVGDLRSRHGALHTVRCAVEIA